MSKNQTREKPTWAYVGPDGPLAHLYRNDGRMYRYVGRAKTRPEENKTKAPKKTLEATRIRAAHRVMNATQPISPTVRARAEKTLRKLQVWANWRETSDGGDSPDHQEEFIQPQYHSATVQDGPWLDLETCDDETIEKGVMVMTKNGMRVMDRGIFLDKHTGLEILGQQDGDPSHSNWEVNSLQEKAASIAGALLTSPGGLRNLPIPKALGRRVACWNHKIYKHRYPEGGPTAGPDRCTTCCKEQGCKACCRIPDM